MNVIVANKYQMLLENLGVDIIKEIDGEFSVDEIIATFQNFFYQRMILDITAIKDYKDIRNLQKLSISLNMDKVILLLDGTDDTSNPNFISQLVSMGIYNFAKDIDGIQYLYNSPNSYRDVAQYHQLQAQVAQQSVKPVSISNNLSISSIDKVDPVNDQMYVSYDSTVKVIGVKNITKHAGASTFVYAMKNILAKSYKAVGIEVDKMEFGYFRDKNMISTVSPNFQSVLTKYDNFDVILVDLNNSVTAEGLCQTVIYLVEPSTIKINKLMTVNPSVFKNLKGKKIVLNQCMLSSNEVNEFEYEARIKSFYVMAPFNERDKNNKQMIDFLNKLGFNI